MGHNVSSKNARRLLARLFALVSQPPAPAPESEQKPGQKPESGLATEILHECEDVLRGMPNLKNLQTVIFAFTQDILDNGKPVFELKGSGQRVLYQDIVLTAPDATTFALRLHVDVVPIGHGKSRAVVAGVEMFKEDDPPILFDLTSDEQAEVKIAIELLQWMLDKCPQEKMQDFDSLLVAFGFVENSKEDGVPVKHATDTLNEVELPARAAEPS